jgi:transposase-like protein
MSKRRARYSAEFKQDAVMRMGQGGKTITVCWFSVKWRVGAPR